MYIIVITKDSNITSSIITDLDDTYQVALKCAADWKCKVSELDIYQATKKINIHMEIYDLEKRENTV